MASLAATSGVLIALIGRQSNQKNTGTYIDISIQESTSMAALQTSNANHFTRDGNIFLNGTCSAIGIPCILPGKSFIIFNTAIGNSFSFRSL